MNELTITYVCYRTTNLITGQEYIGVFSYDPNTRKGEYKFDKYIGAGLTYDGQSKLMKSQPEFVKNVTQYGYDSFKREDLLITTDADEAFELEAALVNIDWVNNPMTLNQRTGGRTGILGKIARKRRSVQNTGGSNPKAKAVICAETGKIYGCIKDASDDLEIPYGTLKYQVKTNNTTNIILI